MVCAAGVAFARVVALSWLLAGRTAAQPSPPQGHLGHLLEGLVEPGRPAFQHGLFGSIVACQQAPRPPLWRATRDGRAAYLLASSGLPAEALEPEYEQVQQALGCADVAYFELPCRSEPTSDAGRYLRHCLQYPTYSPLDSIKARLPPDDLEALTTAIDRLTDKARRSCTPVVADLEAAAQAVNDTSSRTTLLALYQGLLASLSPERCDPTKRDLGPTHEERLRAEFGTRRPTFGLEDVSGQCELYQEDTVEHDTELARYIVQELSDGSFFERKMDKHRLMIETMKCGDLQALAVGQGAVTRLHWLREHLLAKRNVKLAKGLEHALAQQPGRSVLAAVGLAHFVDLNGTSSILTLLRQAGFIVEQVRDGKDLACSKSSYSAPIADRPGRCLQPIDREQPASCTAFEDLFKQVQGEDIMYGRAKSSTNCEACANSNQSCSCTVKWANASAFEQLCMSTAVDGVHGQVLEMDKVRNPGSVRPGGRFAEKTVRGLFQNCYATSCSVKLLQEMALRSWYNDDPNLAEGLVALRRPEGPEEEAASVEGWG